MKTKNSKIWVLPHPTDFIISLIFGIIAFLMAGLSVLAAIGLVVFVLMMGICNLARHIRTIEKQLEPKRE